MKSFKDYIGKKTPSIEAIAKKHKVSVDTIKKQVNMGTKIEREHTKSDKEAAEIARDHEAEFPKYYTALKKMEKKLDK